MSHQQNSINRTLIHVLNIFKILGFLQSEGQIQLSKEAAQIDPMVLPVSVPVKDYQTPSKLSNSLNSHLRQNDLSDSAEACPPAPTHKNQGSRVSFTAHHFHIRLNTLSNLFST